LGCRICRTTEEIDKINILNATKLAMDRAIGNLKLKYNVNCKDLIIDGMGWENKFKDYNVKSIVKGDSKYYSIAAASIIAKEYHDSHIKELYENNIGLNEKYDLENNMGYATKKHLDAIELFGNSMYHRKTFRTML
jgi:ribonuclease HII